MKTLKSLLIRTAALGLLAAGLSACNRISNAMNPFYEAPKPVALLGDKNDHALNGERDKVDTARQALQAAATYRGAFTADPNVPVIKPAVVRLMWIPDHLNQNGDLVPAHYYYLKVLDDSFAVQDAFEIEAQLNRGGSAGGSNIPFVTADEKMR